MVQSRRLVMASTPHSSTPTPFAGHAELGRHLTQLLESRRTPKVMLFVGPQALGKSEAALWLMRRDLCTAKKAQPCDLCTACRQTKNNTHPNSVVLDSDEKESIGIEVVRQAIQPYELVSWNKAMRWLIIVDAERLTEAASNTMLKFLEEIPPDIQVIMTSSQPERMLPTLRSRATTYQWHFVASDELQFPGSADHQQVSRCAGRPGWIEAVKDQTAVKADLEQAAAIAEQLLQSRTTTRERLPKERSAMGEIMGREELVVRDVLLKSVGSRRRLLWPAESLPGQLSPTSAMRLVTKYLDRYDFSPNLQPRLLYEDLHLV